MRKILVGAVVAAVMGMPATAHAGWTVGTKSCYVYVDSPPPIGVGTTYPYLYVYPSAPWGHSVHCPLPDLSEG